MNLWKPLPFNWEELSDFFRTITPVLAALASILILLWLANWALFKRQPGSRSNSTFTKQLIMLALTMFGIVAFIAVIPLKETIRGHVFTLVGILFTGIIALSSTNVVANIMSGLMLRIIRSFKTGDFIRVQEMYGRITERGLIHIEIQGENRDLTTFSNLYMVTHPFTVIRNSGTVISINLSLGYDLSHDRIEKLLIEAAKKSGLIEPFVRVIELGDFSISYCIAGLLVDVKRLITSHSDLRKHVLDTLHDDNVEIVSPTFMNQKRITEDLKVLPQTCAIDRGSKVKKSAPEKLIFDKAEGVENLKTLEKEHREVTSLIEELTVLKKTTSDNAILQLELAIKSAQKRIEELESEQETVKYKIDED